MAINFPAAAFLAGLKVPSQIMYCISQDSGAPVVVYKDSQNIQQPINVPPWSGAIQESNYNQQKDLHPTTIATSLPSNSIQSAIRLDGGNQITVTSHSSEAYPNQSTSYYSPRSIIQAPPAYIHVPGQVYAITSQQSSKEKTNQTIENNVNIQNDFNENDNRNGNHSDDVKNFSCSLCKKSFRLKSTLIQHERIHLDSRPFMCTFGDTCRKTFRQKSHLIQHSRIHYDSKPFPCTFQGCGKTFRQRAILSQHERIHCDASSHLLYKNLGENGTLWPHDLPYPNEIQSKTGELSSSPQKESVYPAFTHSVFGNLTDINYQKTETKSEISDQQTSIPLYVRCPICQVSYKQKSTLLQHGCIHIESRPYPCLFLKCGKRFRQQSHLAQHIRIHKNEKPYRCPFTECHGRCFRQKTILNQHIRIHTNSKPYRCSTCGKDFRQQAILSQHEKTHQSHRPFSCPLSNCKRRFINEHDLKKHIESHMNLSKPKKQSSSRSNQEVKPETTYFPPYMQPPTPFNHHIVPNQNPMIHTSQNSSV
ncbi:CLUMA_CG015065, isoform A [Clunio marinus]|uniref:CLUMA_CG015065, isoform A n=1 Tax=Clunio marinus TaxID=568069 RepID=A0A1J1ITW7_9DIPT|nr:CLUMA_CG015065, isoform A [Clunio marinus]